VQTLTSIPRTKKEIHRERGREREREREREILDDQIFLNGFETYVGECRFYPGSLRTAKRKLSQRQKI
jgi:hypothetical protein